MEGERKNPDKKPLNLDWEKLLPTGVNDDEPPPEVVIRAAEPSKSSSMTADRQSGFGDNGEFLKFTDHELEETILRQKIHIKTMGSTLPDGGVKVKDYLRRLEEERERRRLNGLNKVTDESKKPSRSRDSVIMGPHEDSWQERRSPKDHAQSSFGKEFCKRIDENPNSRRVDRNKHCRKRSNELVSQKPMMKRRSSPRLRSDQYSRSFSLNGNGHALGSLKSRANNWNGIVVSLGDDSRTSEDQTVVLDDEEDCKTLDSEEYAEELNECMTETKIYYPSRDDPDPIIIAYADLDCLAPETYLTSTIMNFYIRYLQQQAALTNRVICDYLFFNTYFYEKLKEAVTYKGTDKNTKFVKFRRWWKGVNIFHKAYVLIPIHQDLHWSLVIICIPDKDDDSGPIILHLDSLGLHRSKSVFDNIKSYMKEEWNCLNQEVDGTNIPIVDEIWKHLPHRIKVEKITVPRQRNDYDCGLFVLFFMERFIVDAPGRLVKKKDLPLMFGREWFKPQEASGLRKKIRSLLKEEFRNANRTGQITSTSPKSANGSAESVTNVE